jgi:hypothetical protein
MAISHINDSKKPRKVDNQRLPLSIKITLNILIETSVILARNISKGRTINLKHSELNIESYISIEKSNLIYTNKIIRKSSSGLSPN